MAGVPLRVLEQVVDARLKEIANVTVYLRQVGHVLGSPSVTDPPTISADDLRVRPYVVQHPSPGSRGTDQRLAGMVVDRRWSTQLTCVVGDAEALGPLVDAVEGKFNEWRPVLPAPYNVTVMPSWFTRSFDPGPSQKDDDITPSRFYVPLIYDLNLNS